MTHKHNNIELYKSEESECGYIDGLKSSNLVANPYCAPNQEVYDHLIGFGFRRSGDLLYRPDCQDCLRCIPVRLDVRHFTLNRRFRRVLKKNIALQIRTVKPNFSDAYLTLYSQYLSAKHRGGEMEHPSADDFQRFLISDWNSSLFIEITESEKLMAIAVTDVVEDGLSSVYTFYDPEYLARSLGQFAILQQINLAQTYNKPYLYLGYWIASVKKMSYKADYQPLQYFINNQWLEKEAFEQEINHLDLSRVL
jgi:arginine-tRNA-protein transferase